MLVFHYLGLDPTLSADFDEPYHTAQAQTLGADVLEFWVPLKRPPGERWLAINPQFDAPSF
jgi:hypothetical protein